MYKIVGADQKEYGPATSEQVRQWIARGQANGQTLASFEGSPWKPLSSFPEFFDALRTSVPPPLVQGSGLYQGQQYGGGGQQTNTAAVSGLVLSILGVCCCFPLFSLLGIVFSGIGLAQIRKNPQAYSTSSTTAVIGIVLGIIWILLIAIAAFAGVFDEILKNLPR